MWRALQTAARVLEEVCFLLKQMEDESLVRHRQSRPLRLSKRTERTESNPLHCLIAFDMVWPVEKEGRDHRRHLSASARSLP